MPGRNKKITHTWTNLLLKAASLRKYVWPFYYHQALKGSDNLKEIINFYSPLQRFNIR